MDNAYLKILLRKRRNIYLKEAFCIFYSIFGCASLVLVVVCFPPAMAKDFVLLACLSLVVLIIRHVYKRISALRLSLLSLDAEILLELDPHTALPFGTVRDLLLSLLDKS